MSRAGRLGADDELVVCITGHGVRTADAVRHMLPGPPLVAGRVRAVEELPAAG